MGWGDPPGANDTCYDLEFKVDISSTLALER